MAGRLPVCDFLISRIGSSAVAIPLQHVRETLRPLPVTQFPGMPPFLLGLAILRGIPVPIIDLGRLLGSNASPRTSQPGRFVSLRVGNRTLGLAVDAVVGVRTLPASVLADVPPLLREIGSSHLSLIGALDAELLILLEASRLIPESAWAAIEVAGASA